MPTNGLLTEVRWEWYGTQLSADEASGQTVLSVMNASALALNQDIWIGATGIYTITAIDMDNDTITVSPALAATWEAGTEVVPDVGGQPGQLWVAEVILPDAEEPVEVPLTVTNLLSMPEGTYDPPVAISLSDDLERVIDLPGSMPKVDTSLIPDLPPVDDGSIPSPPTTVAWTQGLFLDPSGQNFILATVTWADPIENTDTSPITDLKEVEVQRKIGSGAWEPMGAVDAGVQTMSGGILPQNATVQYRARARDTSGNVSTWATSSSGTTNTDTGTPGIPSTPTVTAPLSTLKIVWDGLLSGGGGLDVDYAFTEIHVSTTNNFTPSVGTQVGTFRGKGTFLLNGLTPLTTYYVKLINVDRTGNKSGASAQGSASATPDQLLSAEIKDAAISAAKLADNAVTTPKINPEAVTTEKLTVAGFTENLLANGGMEELQAADATKPARWALNQIAATATFATDTANELSGDRCTTLVLSSATASGRIYNTRPIPVKPGDVYYFAIAVKNSRAAPNTNIVEAWTNVDSTNVQNPSHGSTTVTTVIAAETGHTGYTVREGTFTVPAGKTWMTLAVRANATGDGSGQTVYVDDVVVKKLIGDALIVNLTASKITAGTLQADVLLSSKFYTDVSPNARVELDGLGLRAYDENNVNTINISSLDGKGTFQGIDILGESRFGVSDPTSGDSATIFPTGEASFKNVAVNGSLIVQGDDISARLYTLPRGLIARTEKTLAVNQTATGTTENELYEIAAVLEAGRIYRLSIDPVNAESSPAQETGGFRIRYTTNGTTPTTASTIFGGQYAVVGTGNADTSVAFSKTVAPASTLTYRFLINLFHTSAGASDFIRLPSGTTIRINIEDIGAEPPDTGQAPGQANSALTKEFTYTIGWGGTYDPVTGTKITYVPGGVTPWPIGENPFFVDARRDYVSPGVFDDVMIGVMGFSDAGSALRTALSGYTINSVKLYANLYGAWEGSTAITRVVPSGSGSFYLHNYTDTSTPASITANPTLGTDLGPGKQSLKTGMQAYTMPVSVGEALRDNTAKGFILAHPSMASLGTLLDAAGDWVQSRIYAAHGDTAKRPYIKITATK